jgi:glucuronate isomerase
MSVSNFIHDDFLLQSETAHDLYHQFAADQPIIDHHTHLPPEEVAHDQRWETISDLWLSHDHYKWRAMRANGIPESHITGDASPREKFQAWAETVPHTLRNPLYHWTHLELKRCFGIDTLLGPDTAEEIWQAANERLAQANFSARSLLSDFKVEAIGTTDDPNDSLEHHALVREAGISTKVYPTFRPDKALFVDRPPLLNPWLDELAALTSEDTGTFAGLLAALKKRHDFFHEQECRLSDHGLPYCLVDRATEAEAQATLAAARAGTPATREERDRFGALLMFHFGQWNAARDWTMQLHLAPVRSPNSRYFTELGPDSGFDTIGDYPQGERLLKFLDNLDCAGALPKTIVYNLNPRDNAVCAAACGSFQEGPTPSKVQWGSGWWFNDTLQGMTDQLNTLSSIGLLSRFIGMLTDSRSFLSYPRHEYFRRILCNLVGQEVENGLLPKDDALLGALIRNISYQNAKEYLQLP